MVVMSDGRVGEGEERNESTVEVCRINTCFQKSFVLSHHDSFQKLQRCDLPDARECFPG